MGEDGCDNWRNRDGSVIHLVVSMDIFFGVAAACHIPQNKDKAQKDGESRHYSATMEHGGGSLQWD